MSERQKRKKRAHDVTAARKGLRPPPQAVEHQASADGDAPVLEAARIPWSAIYRQWLGRLAETASKIAEPLRRAHNPQVQRLHFVMVVLIPAVLTVVNRNWLFQNSGQMDAWYYFGHFQHFPRFHNLVPGYTGERIAWILPGYFLTHLLGIVPGVIALHVTVFLVCLLALYYIVKELIDGSTALLTAMLLGCNSYFVGPNGWDYPEAEPMMFILLSLALLFPARRRRQILYLVLSGMTWFALVYTYIAWIIFTPGYLYFAAVLIGQKRIWQSAIRICGCVGAGGLLTTFLFWGAYAAMGGQGFFFRQNIASAIYYNSLKTSPYAPGQWWRMSTWIILPVMGYCAAAVALGAAAFRRFHLEHWERAVLWLYVFCMSVMAIETVGANKMLAFDLRTSILLPTLFIALACLLFRVPQNTARWPFYLAVVIGPVISTAPLGSRFLASHSAPVPVVLLECFAILLLSYSSLMRRTPLKWAAMVLFFSLASGALRPLSSAVAWGADYRGAEISERVSRAIGVISKRLPPKTFPVFWIDFNGGTLQGEYRAIMCAFTTHSFSMWEYPKLDKKLRFRSGNRIFLITGERDVSSAARDLELAHMPVTLVSQDLIGYRGTSYWITQFEAR
jgi:hypothetical protein